jgi:hypothetical protein
MPVILYALEAIAPSKSSLNGLDYLINRAVAKIFTITDYHNIAYVREMVDLRNIRYLYIKSLCSFQLQFAAMKCYYTNVISSLAMLSLKPILKEFTINDEDHVTTQLKNLRRRVEDIIHV